MTVGDSPAVNFSSGAEWPEGLHECLLPSEALPTEEDVAIKVKVGHLEAEVTLHGMRCI